MSILEAILVYYLSLSYIPKMMLKGSINYAYTIYVSGMQRKIAPLSPNRKPLLIQNLRGVGV